LIERERERERERENLCVEFQVEKEEFESRCFLYRYHRENGDLALRYRYIGSIKNSVSVSPFCNRSAFIPPTAVSFFFFSRKEESSPVWFHPSSIRKKRRKSKRATILTRGLRRESDGFERIREDSR